MSKTCATAVCLAQLPTGLTHAICMYAEYMSCCWSGYPAAWGPMEPLLEPHPKLLLAIRPYLQRGRTLKHQGHLLQNGLGGKLLLQVAG